jgi:hypothetical protein
MCSCYPPLVLELTLSLQNIVANRQHDTLTSKRSAIDPGLQKQPGQMLSGVMHPGFHCV